MSSAEPPVVRILIVEDHPIVRSGYAQLIHNHIGFEVCGFAATEQEAASQIKTLRPHLAILDLTLREGNALELIGFVSRHYADTKILVISAHDERLYAERSVEAGALGYINKQEAIERLMDGIRCVLAGEVFLSEEITKRMLRRSVKNPRASLTTNPIERLSDRELQAFGYIGSGLTTREIAQQMFVSPKTVERYKENIKQKLQLSNATELAQHATRWRLENP